MKEQITEVLSFLGDRLGIKRFSSKFLSNYPRFVRVFNFAVPATLVVALVFGVGVLSWQIVSLARPGDVKVSSPANGSTVNGDFESQIVFKASQDRPTYNLVMKLDDRVIDSRVGSAIKEGEERTYKFSSGTSGANKFNHNLLSPGVHKLRIEARTGDKVGSGVEIDTSESHFTVKGTKNIVSTGESKTIGASELPLNASPRNASLPEEKKDLLAKLNESLFPKVSAHSGTGKRHGSFVVTGPPGAVVLVGHAEGVLDGCHSGNGAGLSAAGVVGFFDCSVSNQGGTSAVYNVAVGSIPEGWTLQDVHQKQINVEWGQTKSIGFNYIATPAPTPPPPPPPPPAPPAAPEVTGRGDIIVTGVPGAVVLVGHSAGVLPGCTGGNGAGLNSAGAVRFTGCAVSTQGGDSAEYRVVIGSIPAGWTLLDASEKLIRVKKGDVVHVHFTNKAPDGSVSGPGAGGGGGTPVGPVPEGGTPGTAPAPALSYNPDDGPLIALDSLTANEATVSSFGYKLVNNQPANYVSKVYAMVDGVEVSSVNAFSNHATHVNTKLPLPNLKDGNDHTVTLAATNENGKTNSVTVKMLANKPENVTAPSQSHPKGSIEVSVYAHDKPGQAFDPNKDPRIGSLYVDARNIGEGVGQCSPQSGLTDNDRSNASNFGRIHFKDCPAALDSSDNHAKKYEISLIIPEGFAVDPTFNGNTGARQDGNYLKREIKVQKGEETKVSLLLVGSNSNTLTTGEAQRAEEQKKEEATEEHHEGSIAVAVYSHDQPGQSLNKNSDSRIGNVEVKTENIGSAGKCKDENGKDRESGRTDNDRDNAQNFGKIEFKNCPVALRSTDNHAKKYKVSITIPNSFTIDQQFNGETGTTVNGNTMTREVTVRKNKQTDVSFLLIGSNSNSISPTEFKKPNPPGNLTSRATKPGIVVLNWEAPNNTDYYVIERSEDGNSWDILSEEGEITQTSYTDDDVGIGSSRYIYRVYAINRQGFSSDPAETIANTIPVTLSDLKLTEVGPGVVQLDWQTSTPGFNKLSTGIEVSTDNNTWELLEYSPMGNSYTDNTAAFQTQYFYRVSVFLNDTSFESNRITAGITTSPFVPNVIAGNSSANINSPVSSGKVYAAELNQENSEITEDPNGFVINDTKLKSKTQVVVPKGALNFDAQCSIAPTYGNYTLPENKDINGKAYSFTCKDIDGVEVTGFDKPVAITIPMESKYSDYRVYSLTNEKELLSKQKSGNSLLGSPGSVLASTTSTGTFAILVDKGSEKLSTTPWLLIIFVTGTTGIAVFYGYNIFRRKITQRIYQPPIDPDI